MTKTPVAKDLPLPDYYDVMHLHPAADAAMVDQVYWHLARLYNAAIATDREAREKLDALNQAYAVLRSPALREQYDEARGATPGARSQTEREELPPPLAVMDTQRPRPRDGSKTSKSHAGRAWPRLRFRLPRLPGLGRFGQSVPSWQNAVSAAVIAALATAALIAGVEPVLIAVLLIVGLSFTMLPLARKLPRLPSLPRPALPSTPRLRMPRLPQRAPERSIDADALRQSTEAMLSRWRADVASRAASDSDKPALSQDDGNKTTP